MWDKPEHVYHYSDLLRSEKPAPNPQFVAREAQCRDCQASYEQRTALQKRCPACQAQARARTQQRAMKKLKAKRDAARKAKAA